MIRQDVEKWLEEFGPEGRKALKRPAAAAGGPVKKRPAAQGAEPQAESDGDSDDGCEKSDANKARAFQRLLDKGLVPEWLSDLASKTRKRSDKTEPINSVVHKGAGGGYDLALESPKCQDRPRQRCEFSFVLFFSVVFLIMRMSMQALTHEFLEKFQTLSIIVLMPCPNPIHMVAKPNCLSLPSSKLVSVAINRVPEQPSG